MSKEIVLALDQYLRTKDVSELDCLKGVKIDGRLTPKVIRDFYPSKSLTRSYHKGHPVSFYVEKRQKDDERYFTEPKLHKLSSAVKERRRKYKSKTSPKKKNDRCTKEGCIQMIETILSIGTFTRLNSSHYESLQLLVEEMEKC